MMEHDKQSFRGAKIIFHHKQAVWFSASADLAVDATRDFWDIGAYK